MCIDNVRETYYDRKRRYSLCHCLTSGTHSCRRSGDEALSLKVSDTRLADEQISVSSRKAVHHEVPVTRSDSCSSGPRTWPHRFILFLNMPVTIFAANYCTRLQSTWFNLAWLEHSVLAKTQLHFRQLIAQKQGRSGNGFVFVRGRWGEVWRAAVSAISFL